MSADLPYFRRLARYNRWANRRLYAACAELEAGEWEAPRIGFFPSLQKTLNHILVADRIWLARFEGRAHGIQSLDQILAQELDELTDLREAEDERIIGFFDKLSQRKLDADLTYRMMEGSEGTQPLVFLAGHLFNHATHHRGQAHAMLAGSSVKPPPLDFLYYLYSDEAKAEAAR